MDRREFTSKAAISILGISAKSNSWVNILNTNSKTGNAKIPIGMDAHSVRSMRWKARQLIEFAGKLDFDTVLFNGLNYFESLDENHLKSLKKILDLSGMLMYFGVGGLSINSPSYSSKFGTPKHLIRQGIRIAKIFDSSSVNCKIGNVSDRYTDGGILARMEEIISELRSMRSEIQDAGIKFAVENHAGDMRSEEVLNVVDTVGTDICGVMLDPGNAVYAMENPMSQIEKLGKHVICTSVRDYSIWESENGATFQWTAIGNGSLDVDLYTRRLSELCPGVPLHIESISDKQTEIPFLNKDFWLGYPNLKAGDLLDFYTMLRKGKSRKLLSPPQEMYPDLFAQEQQKRELIKSIDYLRSNCPAVNKYKH